MATKLNNIIGIFHTIMQFPLCLGTKGPVTAKRIQARGQASTSGSVEVNRAIYWRLSLNEIQHDGGNVQTPS